MKIEVYYHNCLAGDIPSKLDTELISAIKSLDYKIYNGCSRDLRKKIKESLLPFGWSEKVQLDASTKINITSMNQEYGLCLQTGNMSRFYADLIKLEYLHKKEKLRGAFYILPSKTASKILGSNIVNFNRFKDELSVFQQVITIPIKVIGIR